MTISGSNAIPQVIADADAFIALVNSTDALHEQAVAISQKLLTLNVQVLFPATAIAEAMTGLKRKLENPTIVQQALELVKHGELLVFPVDTSVIQRAVTLFDPRTSKQHTFFDAVVAAVAQMMRAEAIFSFDGWYKAQGFRMAGELIATT